MPFGPESRVLSAAVGRNVTSRFWMYSVNWPSRSSRMACRFLSLSAAKNAAMTRLR